MTGVVGGRRPGRPRSVECDRAILEAALVEYAERGFDGLNVDAVAARAGVSKATIYRRYPSKVELVIAAGYAVAEEVAPKPDTGSLRGDLLSAYQNLARLLNMEVLGRAVRQVVADSLRHADLAAMHEEMLRERRQGTIDALDRAKRRGELRRDLDVELAADMLAGPLFYRHIISHMPIDDHYVEQVVETFLRAEAR